MLFELLIVSITLTTCLKIYRDLREVTITHGQIRFGFGSLVIDGHEVISNIFTKYKIPFKLRDKPVELLNLPEDEFTWVTMIRNVSGITLAPSFISIYNFKGGVGKTTISAGLFDAVQFNTKNNYIFIDMDPQCSLTQQIHKTSLDNMGVEDEKIDINLFEEEELNIKRSIELYFADKHNPRDINNIQHWQFSKIIDVKRSRNSGFIDGSIHLDYWFTKNVLEANFPKIMSFFIDLCIETKSAYVILDLNPGATVMNRFFLGNSVLIIQPFMPDIFSARSLTAMQLIMDAELKGKDQLLVASSVKIHDKEPTNEDKIIIDQIERKFNKKTLILTWMMGGVYRRNQRLGKSILSDHGSKSDIDKWKIKDMNDKFKKVIEIIEMN